MTAARRAEIVWQKAVRRLPGKLPNGSEYNVIGETQPGHYVVQETTGFERLGSIWLFIPGAGQLRTLLDAAIANPKGSRFGLDYAQMAGIGHVTVQINAPNPPALWSISVADGSITKVPLERSVRVEPVRLKLGGVLFWSYDESSGIMRGTKKLPDSEGFQFTGDGAWVAKWTGTGKARRLNRWNVESGERSILDVPYEAWSLLACADNWCTGRLQQENGQDEIATINSQGETRTTPWAANDAQGEAQYLIVGRFAVLKASGVASGSALIWDVHTGQVASLPKHTASDTSIGTEADAYTGGSFLLLSYQGNEKVLLNLGVL